MSTIANLNVLGSKRSVLSSTFVFPNWQAWYPPSSQMPGWARRYVLIWGNISVETSRFGRVMAQEKCLHSLKLTACPWKWMVGVPVSFWGPAYFQVRAVSFREWGGNSFPHRYTNTSSTSPTHPLEISVGKDQQSNHVRIQLKANWVCCTFVYICCLIMFNHFDCLKKTPIWKPITFSCCHFTRQFLETKWKQSA